MVNLQFFAGVECFGIIQHAWSRAAPSRTRAIRLEPGGRRERIAVLNFLAVGQRFLKFLGIRLP